MKKIHFLRGDIRGDSRAYSISYSTNFRAPWSRLEQKRFLHVSYYIFKNEKTWFKNYDRRHNYVFFLS